jgi:UDPglucose--hexose-1-phosphate uridylyltransferase
MPLFRKDPFGRAWVLLSPERGLLPSDFGSVPAAKPRSPLSPGNEGRVSTEIAAVRPSASTVDGPDWRMRVIGHPAALVSPRSFAEEGESLFRHAPSSGYQEIIVEHPDATMTLDAMPRPHLIDLLKLYRDRLALHGERPGVKHVQLTRNVGRAAGALFEHPHAQLLAVPVANRWVQEEMEVAAVHHAEHGTCLFCDVLARELELRERLVTYNDEFVAFAPFASKTPFETWILPRRHGSAYAGVAANTLPLLADIVQAVTRALNAALDSPPYNMAFHTAPRDDHSDFHWHIEVLPRLTTQAGFDWGAGFFVNPTPPEDAVRFLREALALQEVAL